MRPYGDAPVTLARSALPLRHMHICGACLQMIFATNDGSNDVTGRRPRTRLLQHMHTTDVRGATQGHMPGGRYGCSATVSAHGTWVVHGGISRCQDYILSDTYEYAFAARRWSRVHVQTPPAPRTGHVGARPARVTVCALPECAAVAGADARSTGCRHSGGRQPGVCRRQLVRARAAAAAVAGPRARSGGPPPRQPHVTRAALPVWRQRRSAGGAPTCCVSGRGRHHVQPASRGAPRFDIAAQVPVTAPSHAMNATMRAAAM